MQTTFKEVQRFNQPWLWILVISVILLEVGIFGNGFYQQLILGEPWGDHPMSDNALIIVNSAIIIIGVGVIYLLFTMRLITEVRPEGLKIHFYPLRKKRIPYRDIKSCEVQRYKPIREYGGWGIRYGRGGWAYNVHGNQGVQLVLKNGKRILIGSQRSEELASAINQYYAC